VPEETWKLEIPAHGNVSRDFTMRLADTAPVGRQVLALRVTPAAVDGADAVVAVDVER
jgi:hypothetical protein